MQHGPLARYVKLWVAHTPGMPGTFSPTPRVNDPGMHHGKCVTHEPWCMPGSLISGFLRNRWRGKRYQHFRRMRNPQFYVSVKRPPGNTHTRTQAHTQPHTHTNRHTHMKSRVWRCSNMTGLQLNTIFFWEAFNSQPFCDILWSRITSRDLFCDREHFHWAFATWVWWDGLKKKTLGWLSLEAQLVFQLIFMGWRGKIEKMTWFGRGSNPWRLAAVLPITLYLRC